MVGRRLRLLAAIGPDRTHTLEVLGTRHLLHVLREQLEAEGVGVATTPSAVLRIHDRDTIFSRDLDQGIRHLGLRVLKTPPQSPQANALCERLLGTARRECLDF